MTTKRQDEPSCGKGTSHGAAAAASRYGWAACVLEMGHREPCDSGPAPEPDFFTRMAA
jgi:hypothetical protein